MKKKLLIAAGAALAALLLLAVWLWPREYSPADPRGYIPFRWIPVEPYVDGLGLFRPSKDKWDFEEMQKYDVHLSYYLADKSERDVWMDWNNAAFYDFLLRMTEGKRAILRKMDYGGSCDIRGGVRADLVEIRWPTVNGEFILREDHRRCVDTCYQERVYENEEPQATLSRLPHVDKICLSLPTVHGAVRYDYITGRNAEMDAALEDLIAQLTEVGLLVQRT